MDLQKRQAGYIDAAANGRKVAYVVVGQDCVFSGLERPGTTINFAEEIIKAICAAEQFDVRQMRFYDLQTHLGYDGKEPGEYELDQLTLGYGSGQFGFTVLSWAPAAKWPLILEAFAEEIGGSGAPVNVSCRPRD